MFSVPKVCLLLLLCSSGSASTSHWNYNEDEWPIQCKEGTKQSPIALSKDITENEEFSSLIFEHTEVTYPVLSQNNGHSIEIRLHVQAQPTVKGGGLPYVYALDHLHFHWMSEHVIENERFPLELHMVHYANEYGNVSEALKHYGGVAVFAVLFYLSPDADSHFEPLVEVIEKIHDHVNTIQEMYIKTDDFLPRDKAGYYRYNGSLTTPDCNEGVIWTVFTNMLPISKTQAQSFPHVVADDQQELRKNYRSLQKLNGRRVLLRSSPMNSSAAFANIESFAMLTLPLLLKLIFS